MEMASISSSPRTVEEIFKDYSGRRAGVVRALTYGTRIFANLSLFLLSLFGKLSHPVVFSLCFSQMLMNSTSSAIQVRLISFFFLLATVDRCCGLVKLKFLIVIVIVLF